MKNHSILLSAPYMLPFTARFQPVFDHYRCKVILPEVNERLSPPQILAYAGQFDGAICGDDQYDAETLRACAPRLKVISKWGTGIDSIDQAAAQELGIQVFRTVNAFTVPVSDSVMGYILAFARRQPWMDKAVKSGQWTKIPARSLSECTLGVIGVGHIGKEVLRKGHAFDMRLLANDIVEPPQDFLRETPVEMVDLDDLLSQSDFISVNCDLNPTSFHLLTCRAFELMKSSAVVINTARGPIIDESDLVEALQERLIAGAAMDVFEVEPLPADSPLREMDNVMLAPHNSNSSPAFWEKVHWNTILNLLAGLGIPHADFDEVRQRFSQV